MTADTRAAYIRQQITEKAQAATQTVTDAAKAVSNTVVNNAGRGARIATLTAVLITAGCGEAASATGGSGGSTNSGAGQPSTAQYHDNCFLDSAQGSNPAEYMCFNHKPYSKQPGQGDYNALIITSAGSSELDVKVEKGGHEVASQGGMPSLEGALPTGSTTRITQPGTTQISIDNCSVSVTATSQNGQLQATRVTEVCTGATQ